VNRDKNLIESNRIKYDDEVNVKVHSVFNNHNILELNNRDLMISGTYPVINQDELVNKVKEKNISGRLWNNPNTPEFKPVLSDIEPPFRLLKKAYSDTLKIIKEQDTILVLMNK
tara:strand:- start:172109 stop:172450 length:342 start_codon:yes stop_codon:yes gene_type:complete